MYDNRLLRPAESDKINAEPPSALSVRLLGRWSSKAAGTRVRPKGTLKPNEDGGRWRCNTATFSWNRLINRGLPPYPQASRHETTLAKNAEQEVFVEPTPIFARGPASCAETWATKAMWAPSLRARNQVYHSNQFVGSQNNLMSDADCKIVKLNSTFNFAICRRD